MRQGVEAFSITKGQGYVKCSCKGTCANDKCTCFKAGRKCNSRCHAKNGNCQNHDECEVPDISSSSDDDAEEKNDARSQKKSRT